MNQTTEQLLERIEKLEQIVNFFTRPDKYYFQRPLELANGAKIGIAPTSKLSFFGSAAIAQPSTSGNNAGWTSVGGTAVKNQDTFSGNIGTTAYTINDIVLHLKQLGLLAL